MFEKIVDILKNLFEKYLLSSLISIVITIIIFYFTPEKFSFFVKVGKNFYLIFWFSLVMFIVESFKRVFKFLRRYLSDKKQLSQSNAEYFDNTIRNIYNSLDTLSPHELDVVQYFVDNNNETITTMLDYSDLELWRLGWIDHRSYKIKDKPIKSVDVYDVTKSVTYNKNSYVMQFKLKKEIYDFLILIKDKYGKISRF